MRKAFGLTCLLAVGCSSGTSMSPPASSPPTKPGDYVALSQTIFMGDNITQNWPLASTSPQENTTIIISQGTSSSFTQYADKCVSGCTPNALQNEAPTNKRLVLLVGEFDALKLCGGSADPDLPDNLDDLVHAAQSLFGLEVWVGTVPPIYSSTGTPLCQTETSSINQQIKDVALANGAHLVDFASVLVSSADVNLAAKYSSSGMSYLPSATGYTVVTGLYNQENQ